MHIFGNEMEMFEVIFEITNGNRKSIQRMQAPRIMIEQQFLQLAEQAYRSTDPIRIVLKREEPIYNNFTNEWVNREYSITYDNDARKRSG